MTDAIDKLDIKRILVALDTSARSDLALEAAAELAAELRAQLLGLFVEDINLLHWAGLPFAREVGHISATERHVAFPDIERAFKSEATRTQRMLEETAERLQLQWSFRVMRGQIIAEVLSVATEADLIIFGKTGRTQNGLKSSRTTASHRQVLVLFDGSSASLRALAAATQLAQTATTMLSVLISDETPERWAELRQIAASRLAHSGVETRFLHTSSDNALKQAQAALAEKPGIIVLARKNNGLSPDDLARWIRTMGSPVVLAS